MKNHEVQPPSLAIRLLNWFCPDDLLEGVLSDFQEQYEESIKLISRQRAGLQFYWNVFRFFHPYILLKNTFISKINHFMMFRNYMLLAFRNLRKNKGYTLINVFGLTMGITCALLILTYIVFELSFDKQHANYQRIIRITEQLKAEDGSLIQTAVTPPMVVSSMLTEQIPEVELLGRMYPLTVFLSGDDKHWEKENLFTFADSTITEIFTFKSIVGDLNSALSIPFNVVITKSIATRYFGNLPLAEAIGKVLYYEDESGKQQFNVAAIIDDLPENSHFDFNVLGSFNTLDQIMPWYKSWYHPYLYTYGLIRETNSTTASIEQKVNTFLKENLPAWEKEKREYSIQYLQDIHLESSLISEWKANSKSEYVTIFALVGIFIVFIACVNFINLSTSKSIKRAKEVGVRKVLGATRKMLILQFLAESTLITSISFLISLLITQLFLLDIFGSFISVNLSLDYLLSPAFLMSIVGSFILISLLSGIYPAFALSSFQPISALQKQVFGGYKTSSLRSILVVFQFIVSSFLIAGTLIVVKQVDFMRNTNLGFNDEYIVIVKLNDQTSQINYAQFIDQIKQYSIVKEASVSSHVPGDHLLYDNPVKPENSKREDGYNMFTLNVGNEFANVYDLKVLAGRNFSKTNNEDENHSILINESAAKFLGWETDDALGRKIELTWYTDSAIIKNTEVIGVVRDFHFKSLHNKVDPLIIHVNTHPYYTENISIKFTSTGYSNAMSFLNEEWKKFSPEHPLDSRFLDEKLNMLYYAETKAADLLSAFAFIAILISCLGLLGLSIFTAERRTKEIGIRKTMGARTSDIVALLSKNFLFIIILGNLIALPLVWVLVSIWLRNFAYQTDIGWSVFILTLLSTLVVGFVTMSFQSVKAAFTNPIESLKEE